ncbi:MAG: PEGA domain-containing protein [Ignavibacteria bacterium]|nr:PEGA domain-containing protein [Ignavibacteria bacterium]
MKIFLFIFLIFFDYFLYSQSDSLRINYNLINSQPQNAEVFLDGEYIGSTPLYFLWRDTVFPKTLTLRLKGFTELSESFYSPETIKRDYLLKPLRSAIRIKLVMENKSDYFSSPRKIFPIVISSLAAISSGFSAYYFKKLSIQNREAYEQSGDSEILKRKRKYDIISGISMGVFQVSFSFLLYFLFED